MKDVMGKATERIGEKDTFGLFMSPEQYLICYNAMCVDIASDVHAMSEADYLQMIDVHNLSDKLELMPLYRDVGSKLQAQLDGGESDEKAKEEEAAEAAR